MSETEGQFYYVDASGARQGPVTRAQILRRIEGGSIGPTTLMWEPGMPDWQPATDFPEFAARLGPVPPPPRPSAGSVPPAGPAPQPRPQPATQPRPEPFRPQPGPEPMSRPGPAFDAPGDQGPVYHSGMGGPLLPAFELWPLCGRSLLAGIGQLLVIPSPWTGLQMTAYLARSVRLPDGTRFGFAGTLQESWWIFGVLAVLLYVGNGHPLLGLLNAFVFMPLMHRQLLIWFLASLRIEGHEAVRLRFTGSMQGVIGWAALTTLAFITIIGWAWVAAAAMRWAAGKVEGGPRFAFTGTGLGILGMGVLSIVGFCLIIPIPWVIRIVASYYVTAITARPAA